MIERAGPISDGEDVPSRKNEARLLRKCTPPRIFASSYQQGNQPHEPDDRAPSGRIWPIAFPAAQQHPFIDFQSGDACYPSTAGLIFLPPGKSPVQRAGGA